MATNKSDKLKKDYNTRQASAGTFCSALVEQIKKLTSQENISLAVPIESRVKSWSSISGKIDRSNLELEDILQLNDFVGIRLILLFKRDLDKCSELIEKNLEVIEKEDTASRLDESQFGYQSYHYVIKLPKEWLSIPTFNDFAEYKAEIQVRTIAQHIWAAASHNLQYKQKDNVPKTVRRSIYRVSALLETVDLEFERVLSEREQYVQWIKDLKDFELEGARILNEHEEHVKELKPETHDEKLNVDLLKEILDAFLPIENRGDDEDYSGLIQLLSTCGIEKPSELISLISEKLEIALQIDVKKAGIVKKSSESFKGLYNKYEIDRASRGIFYNHTDLIQMMVGSKFKKET